MVERRKKKIPSIFKKSEKINMKMMKKEKTGFFDVAFPPPLSSCSSCCCSCCSCSCSASATSSSSSTSTTSFPSFHFFQSVFWNPPSLPSALDLFRPSNRPFPPCPRPPPSSPFNLICDERSCWCKSINCKTKRKVEQKMKKKKKKRRRRKRRRRRKPPENRYLRNVPNKSRHETVLFKWSLLSEFIWFFFFLSFFLSFSAPQSSLFLPFCPLYLQLFSLSSSFFFFGYVSALSPNRFDLYIKSTIL